MRFSKGRDKTSLDDLVNKEETLQIVKDEKQHHTHSRRKDGSIDWSHLA
jgi:hypothetical protein